MRSIWLAVFGLALSATAAADQVDFGLNNDAFAVRYSSERAGGTSSIDGEWYHHIDHGNVAALASRSTSIVVKIATLWGVSSSSSPTIWKTLLHWPWVAL